MRSTYLFLSVAAQLASAFVIPDESILADIVSETRQPVNDQLAKADVDMSLLGISHNEHRGPGRHGDWRDDDEYPRHGDWPGHGDWRRHGDWPDDDECPEHGDWPGYDEDPHGRWPGDEHPGYGRRPGYGGWPGQGDDREDRYRRIDACPGPLCRKDRTTWELIKECEHTSRLAELIADDKALIEILNSTTGNHTFFAPTNHVLEKLPRERNGPSSKFMSSLLRYHILPGRFSIHHVAGHQTLATKLEEPALGFNLPQRIAVRQHHDGVVLNGKSRVVGADMKTKNGIIHIITSPLHPPPETRTMLHHSPAHFSTFTLALAHTKLTYNLDPAQRKGGTTFVPTNAAFRRLGEHVNRFLFSAQGEGCLRALMQYHIVPNRTLYSDVLYSNGKAQGLFSSHGNGHGHGHKCENGCVDGPEEDSVNVRLVTLLKERDLGIDIKRGFGEVGMRVNGFGRVERLDLLARDGVVHVLDRVLVPPSKIQIKVIFEGENEEELMIEDLVGRLDGCVYEGTHGEL
ncbi:uncharacterized protein N7479_008415 [Penicillium vulpinum]|uniref:FAS1 domain-containing protein n=1 Tax=Penicillium vulpinum TaxID=29845 RepID=A0A1V6RF51_9EURO|nr:uncharacterized protein N7479_008415 [Penicillium vulpinum]KAJ5961265.1 hypothetical protein N7479_008415 [Penicillium vulpinum]OQE00180.1 hypothetical protein PENVUL_c057G04879 [Penicillium vulpinum]